LHEEPRPFYRAPPIATSSSGSSPSVAEKRIHREFIAVCSHASVCPRGEQRRVPVIARPPPVRSPVPGPPWPRYGAEGRVAFGKLMKINHPAPGDVVRSPAHVAGYGTAFEGTISLRIRDDDGTVIARGTAQGGSNGLSASSRRTWTSPVGPTSFWVSWRPSRRASAARGRISTWTESRSSSAKGMKIQ
jgi:hypothetical protein